ncbi:hypothetical protein SprV_0401623500 [Sparganum proliferum]
MDVHIVPILHSKYGGPDTVADGNTFYKLCNSKYMAIKSTGNCISYLMRYGLSDKERQLDDHVRFKVEFCYKNSSSPTKPTGAWQGVTTTTAPARATRLVDKFDLLNK